MSDPKGGWRGKSADEIFDLAFSLGWNEAIDKCQEVADEYAAPNRFTVSDQWKEDMSPADVYDTAAVDVGGWIANEIRKLTEPDSQSRE